MATLLLGGAESRAGGTQIGQPHLRQWLAGSWALLFSHPGDFVRCELEMDRWVSVMQHTFASRRIKPLELPAARGAGPPGSWVGEAGGDARSVALLDPRETRLTVRDLRAQALQEEIT